MRPIGRRSSVRRLPHCHCADCIVLESDSDSEELPNISSLKAAPCTAESSNSVEPAIFIVGDPCVHVNNYDIFNALEQSVHSYDVPSSVQLLSSLGAGLEKSFDKAFDLLSSTPICNANLSSRNLRSIG